MLMTAVCAIATGAENFHNFSLGCETGGLLSGFEARRNAIVLKLVYVATVCANQKMPCMTMFGVDTADIGMQAFELVSKAVFLQKVERAINGWWCWAAQFALEFV